MRSSINDLAGLQKRKAELSVLCKEKEKQMGEQVDYISEHLGSIALRSFIGGYGKKDASTKSEIISLLVSEGVEVAFEIQKDPHNIKDKVVDFIKKATAGVINLIVK
jgi:hypothetical protein